MRARFEWDPVKAAINLRKHHIGFDLASRVFADPLSHSEQDRIENGEGRWPTMGMVDGGGLLVVAHTVGEQDDDGQPSKSSVSSRPARPTGARDAIMNNIKRSIELAKLPPLTAEQKAELKALDSLPDSEIDYSDIPELPDEFWKSATRGQFYKPVKTSTTVRIDSDVLAWLRRQGKGYQTRINAILRDAMLASMK